MLWAAALSAWHSTWVIFRRQNSGSFLVRSEVAYMFFDVLLTNYTVLLGGVFLPPSLFWLGFTSYKFLPIWAPMISGLLFGWAATLIFVSFKRTVIANGLD